MTPSILARMPQCLRVTILNMAPNHRDKFKIVMDQLLLVTSNLYDHWYQCLVRNIGRRKRYCIDMEHRVRECAKCVDYMCDEYTCIYALSPLSIDIIDDQCPRCENWFCDNCTWQWKCWDCDEICCEDCKSDCDWEYCYNNPYNNYHSW